MQNKILSALKKNNIDNYFLQDMHEESIELFFIKKTLDVRRRKSSRQLSLTIFRDFEKNDVKMRGVSTVSLYTDMTDDELDRKIKDTYYAASFVCNPFFELDEGVKETASSVGELGSLLEENTRIMSEALFAEDIGTDSFLNSAELFVRAISCRIIGSNGTDVSYQKNYIDGEFVTQCKDPQDVETYQSFHYSKPDAAALREKVKLALEMSLSRAKATAAPAAGSYRVILSGEYVRTMFEYYLERGSSPMIYPKYSNFEVGTKVQGEDVTGDRLTVSLVSEIPYSAEGVPMPDRSFIGGGELKLIHGNTRFNYYLGLKPTGLYSGTRVTPGTISFDDMKKEPYLHIVNFSDFQMDSFSGHFGGEIRLAFLYDGEKVTPVTGGSINGSILDVQKNFTLSAEMQVQKDYEGPFAICLNDVKVAGA